MDAHSRLLAPSTTPTTLYRLEKKVTQSLRVPFSLSSKSFHSGDTSSALVEVLASARDASCPAKAKLGGQWRVDYHGSRVGNSLRTVVGASRLVGFVTRHIIHLALRCAWLSVIELREVA